MRPAPKTFSRWKSNHKFPPFLKAWTCTTLFPRLHLCSFSEKTGPRSFFTISEGFYREVLDGVGGQARSDKFLAKYTRTEKGAREEESNAHSR